MKSWEAAEQVPVTVQRMDQRMEFEMELRMELRTEYETMHWSDADVEQTTESETVQKLVRTTETVQSSGKRLVRKTESKTMQTTEPQMGQSAEQRLAPQMA
jgi:hypothetical protein